MAFDSNMREISPAENMSVNDFLTLQPIWVQELAAGIRAAKREGRRSSPSARLIDQSALLTRDIRHRLLDKVATLVDENLFGRSEMCMQFVDLVHRALTHLKLPARSVMGIAIYYSTGREVFRWNHAWVRVGAEVIDGNVDSIVENPVVPSAVTVQPYWGPIAAMPADRRLREEHGKRLSLDRDVSEIWWPELRTCLDDGFMGGVEPCNAPDRQQPASSPVTDR